MISSSHRLVSTYHMYFQIALHTIDTNALYAEYPSTFFYGRYIAILLLKCVCTSLPRASWHYKTHLVAWLHTHYTCTCRVYQCTRGSGSGHDCGTLLANAPSNTYALNAATLCIMHAVDRVLLPPTAATSAAASNANRVAVAVTVAAHSATDATAVLTGGSSASSSVSRHRTALQHDDKGTTTAAAVAGVPTVLNIIQSRPELSQFYNLLITAGGLPSANGKHS
jgi:hypothetical protein